MAVAADVLAAIDPALELPRSVRDSGLAPWRLQAPAGELAGTLAAAAARMAMLTGAGRLGVIVPAGQLPELTKAVAAELPGATGGEDPELESPVVVLSVRQAKGLEFDSVLIAEPGQILAESPRGLNDLYVAHDPVHAAPGRGAHRRAAGAPGRPHPGHLSDRDRLEASTQANRRPARKASRRSRRDQPVSPRRRPTTGCPLPNSPPSRPFPAPAAVDAAPRTKPTNGSAVRVQDSW